MWAFAYPFRRSSATTTARKNFLDLCQPFIYFYVDQIVTPLRQGCQNIVSGKISPAFLKKIIFYYFYAVNFSLTISSDIFPNCWSEDSHNALLIQQKNA